LKKQQISHTAICETGKKIIMGKSVKNISGFRTRSLRDYWANHVLLTEFLSDQLPIIAQPFAVAGVRVPI
jgi:hypothetical protein